MENDPQISGQPLRRQASRVAWAFTSAAAILLTAGHLWPRGIADYSNDGAIHEPYWESAWAPFDMLGFEVFALIALCLHGYAQGGNAPRLGLATGLASGIGAFIAILYAYYQLAAPILMNSIDDTFYWSLATANKFLGGRAGMQAEGVVTTTAFLLATLVARSLAPLPARLRRARSRLRS